MCLLACLLFGVLWLANAGVGLSTLGAVCLFFQVHDFWHVLSGLPPTVVGEIALKWFEMMQTGLPVTALSAFVGPLRLTRGTHSRAQFPPPTLHLTHPATIPARRATP